MRQMRLLIKLEAKIPQSESMKQNAIENFNKLIYAFRVAMSCEKLLVFLFNKDNTMAHTKANSV